MQEANSCKRPHGSSLLPLKAVAAALLLSTMQQRLHVGLLLFLSKEGKYNMCLLQALNCKEGWQAQLVFCLSLPMTLFVVSLYLATIFSGRHGA